MDGQLRTLERAVNSGREDLIPLYGEARIRAGLFWAERVNDRYLHDSLALHNLPVGDARVNIIYGLTQLRNSRGITVQKTIDDWLSFSTLHSKKNPGRVSMASPELKSAVSLALFDCRNDPAFTEIVKAYANAEFNNQHGPHCHAKFCCNPESPESAPYTIEDISMQRTRRIRTLNSFPRQGYNARIILAPGQSVENLETYRPQSPSEVAATLLGNNPRAIAALQYFTVRFDNTFRTRIPHSQAVPPNALPPLVIERYWEGRDGFPSTVVYSPGHVLPHTSTRSGFFVEAPDETPYALCWRQMPDSLAANASPPKHNRAVTPPALDVRVSNTKPADRCLIGHDSIYPLQKNDRLLYCPDHVSSIVHQKCSEESDIDTCVLLGCDQPYQTRKPLEIHVKQRGAI